MGISCVDSLGEDIERAWSARDYEPSSFPDICVERLGAAHLHEHLSTDEILSFALQGPLPQQSDPQARFGQPPVTLFRSRRFQISALFWVDATTAIHDHGFSGAFQVLAGSSIETTFRFEVSRDIGGQLRFGDLHAQDASLLRQGDVRPIVAGPKFIHSLFHLPRPTVSLVVRTFWDVKPGIQLAYLPPGIAHNAFFEDETLDRMIQVVEMLRKVDDAGFDERVRALVESADLHTAFAVIKSCVHSPNRERLVQIIECVRDPQAAKLFSEWAVRAERIKFINSRRAVVHDPDLRFLLAVLLNLHRRVDALALVGSYSPGVPAARQIASWLNKLSTVTMRLQLADGAWEPNLLGLPTFSDRLEDVLTAALDGRDDTRTKEETEFLGKLRALSALVPLFL